MPMYRIVVKQKVTETKIIEVEAPSRRFLTAQLVFNGLEATPLEVGSEVYGETPEATDGYEGGEVTYGDRWVDDIEEIK